MDIPFDTFVEFHKIARLSRECVISEKIDGSNGIISISEDGKMLVGSRTRWITPENDNYGFAKWAMSNQEELLKLGPGRHFGEWWGNGCQRGYNLTKGEKRFSLFNTIRWCAWNAEPQQITMADPRIIKFQEQAPTCCYLVPVLYSGIFTTEAVESALEDLRANGSKASPGFAFPEGVVAWHTAANCGFKKTLEKDDIPKLLQK